MLAVDSSLSSIAFLGLSAYVFITISFKLPVAEIAVLTALLGTFIQGRIRLELPVMLFGLFVLWAALGSMQAINPSVSLDAVYEQVKLFVIMFCAVNTIRTETQLRWVLFIYVATFLVFGVWMSLWFYSRGITHMGRAIGYATYTNPNDLAALCLLALGGLAGLADATKRPLVLKGMLLFACVTSIALIVFTQSRGALLAVGVTFLPLLVKSAMKSKRLLIAFLVVGVIGIYTLPGAAWERLAGLRNFSTQTDNRDVDPEGSAAERWGILQTAFRIVKDNPAFGVGLGNYGIANAVYSPHLGKKDTHNTYVNVAAETGFFGLLLYLAIVGIVLGRSYRVVASSKAAMLRAGRSWNPPMAVLVVKWMMVGFGAFCIAGLFGSYGRIAFTYTYMGLLWAAGSLCANQVLRPIAIRRPSNLQISPIVSDTVVRGG